MRPHPVAHPLSLLLGITLPTGGGVMLDGLNMQAHNWSGSEQQQQHLLFKHGGF